MVSENIKNRENIQKSMQSNDFSADIQEKDSQTSIVIENDCTNTSLWIENFTQGYLTQQSSVKI